MASLDHSNEKIVTVPHLLKLKEQGEKIAMLTCYDASFSALMNRCGVDVLLVGDSLGMVCQGHTSTLPVTMAEMVYHTSSVARVKLEGGTWLAPTIQFLTERSVPVCAHLGLTPQSVHKMGGYKVQGKTNEAAELLLTDAQGVQAAGADLLVLEGIPRELGRQVTSSLTIPTIGIGAGPDCSGQVLVMHDLLGVFNGKKARFVKNFMEGQIGIDSAIKAYVGDVKEETFPAMEHCF
ncbi:MAG: panB [Solimicrobium sp.]|nr:panB [Solimicrobium sp.]